MKKVLALVLAVAMLSTVAFADSSDEGKYLPGEEIEYSSTNVPVGTSVDELNDDNYSIKKVTYEKGKAYVDSIVLDDDEGDCLTITLKKDYSMDKLKDLEMTIELRGKGKDVEDFSFTVEGTVGYGVEEIALDDEELDLAGATEDVTSDKATHIVKVVESADPADKPYGTLEFDTMTGDSVVEVRVYEGDKFFLGQNVDADKKVLIANADSDAEISFLNFEGKPSFNSTATVYFYEVGEDGFVYELTGEGKIKASAAKWSEDDGCWVLKTRTLGSYVFSDKALTSAASSTEDAGTANPDTGANDVVGIATALAVVSLVAAGAVSLKK